MNEPEQTTVRIGDDGEVEGGLPMPEGKPKRKRRSRLAMATRRASVVGFWTVLILLSALGGVTGIALLNKAGNNGSYMVCRPYVDDLSAGNNKLLVHVGYSTRLHQYDALLMNFDGSERKRLEGDFQHSLSYSLSPDGTYFIDSGFDDNTHKNELYITNLSTMTRRPLTSGILPGWAWDSKHIAFVDGPGVFTMDIDGTNLKFVGDSTGVNFPPTWSPDGKTLAISVNQSRATDIYLVNLQTATRSALIKNGKYPGAAAWSPDGQNIVFYVDRDIVLVKTDGGTVYNVTKGKFDGVSHPVWSSDGKQIAFVGWKNGQRIDIYVTNLDGSEIRSVYTPTC